MARYRFRLKTLLAMREAERESCRAQLAEVLTAERALDDKKQSIENELFCQRSRSRARLAPGRIDLNALTTADGYERGLRSRLRAINADAAALAVSVVERRQALAAADREVRALEKLRDRQLEDFRRDSARAETKELDEAASRAFHSQVPQ
jgi:flagellar protein FliJ